jgi:hypothetical protein
LGMRQNTCGSAGMGAMWSMRASRHTGWCYMLWLDLPLRRNGGNMRQCMHASPKDASTPTTCTGPQGGSMRQASIAQAGGEATCCCDYSGRGTGSGNKDQKNPPSHLKHWRGDAISFRRNSSAVASTTPGSLMRRGNAMLTCSMGG